MAVPCILITRSNAFNRENGATYLRGRIREGVDGRIDTWRGTDHGTISRCSCQ